MDAFWRLFKAEYKKLHGSACILIVWLLPALFILVEFSFFEYKLFGINNVTDEYKALVDTVQIKMVGALWGSFFYPALIALLPALIFRVEHRNSTWRHLGTMPVSQGQIFFVKAIWTIILCLCSLTFVWLLLMIGRSASRYVLSQEVEAIFHGLDIAKVLGWLWLGSLPVMGFYLWISNRINSLAVPIVFGVTGFLLNIALTSQEVDPPWKRDFIPWVTPQVCVTQALGEIDASRKESFAGDLFKLEPDTIRLPDGRKRRTQQNIPDDEVWPPPPPTPRMALASFSLVFGILFLIGGVWDANRCRK